jgi:hypothetical protein
MALKARKKTILNENEFHFQLYVSLLGAPVEEPRAEQTIQVRQEPDPFSD